MEDSKKLVKYLVADTTAFIQNAELQEVAEKVITCQEVIDEITSRRQLRRLVVLPYDLQVKNVDPEYIALVTEFSKKTGDYPSLSATDIKVIALTYQTEKEFVGVSHLRTEPAHSKCVNISDKTNKPDMNADVTGFYLPSKKVPSSAVASDHSDNEVNDELTEKVAQLACTDEEKSSDITELIMPVASKDEDDKSTSGNEDDDDDEGWITPSNIAIAKKQMKSDLIEEKHVIVACMTTDFAMQNVLKQMNLQVSALDGRTIKQIRTFILRCYTCFKTTSVMTKRFCPKCGNDTLKKVAVSLDEEGKMQIHINPRRALTARGKKFSLPTIKGGKHPDNPVLVGDQPMADNRPTRLARTKNNPLAPDYIAGYSPFIMRDVNSKSAQLCIRPGQELKHWMRKNPNESRRRKK